MTTATTTARARNFSAGPAALPETVLEEARRDLWDLFGTGIGILEHSHRGKAFDRITEEAIADCRTIANIPDNYQVIFLQGGASTQFSQIPMNFLPQGQVADYFLTGLWAKKAIKEAKLFSTVNIAASSEDRNFSYLPDASKINYTEGAAYCHYTSNNTIYGTQYATEPQPAKGVPLVCDASSDIFSRPIDVTKYALIYASAQKNLGPAGCALVIISDEMIAKEPGNLPIMSQYGIHAVKESRYNTPNTFATYLMGRVFKWILASGGLEQMAAVNEEKASTLYDYIDSSGFYQPTVTDPANRSKMNVAFRCETADLDSKFVEAAEAAGLKNLKGHRSIGGMRASIYNACTIEAVRALVDFMKEFERQHG